MAFGDAGSISKLQKQIDRGDREIKWSAGQGLLSNASMTPMLCMIAKEMLDKAGYKFVEAVGLVITYAKHDFNCGKQPQQEFQNISSDFLKLCDDCGYQIFTDETKCSNCDKAV